MLKGTRQSSDDKKCAATSISWTKFYWKPCQQNVKSEFENFPTDQTSMKKPDNVS